MAQIYFKILKETLKAKQTRRIIELFYCTSHTQHQPVKATHSSSSACLLPSHSLILSPSISLTVFPLLLVLSTALCLALIFTLSAICFASLPFFFPFPSHFLSLHLSLSHSATPFTWRSQIVSFRFNRISINLSTCRPLLAMPSSSSQLPVKVFVAFCPSQCVVYFIVSRSHRLRFACFILPLPLLLSLPLSLSVSVFLSLCLPPWHIQFQRPLASIFMSSF